MLFTRLLDQVSSEHSAVNISEDWMQGRAGYGGLVAALVYESMRQQFENEVPIRCLQISFVGPVSADTLEISSEVLRQGKSVSQVLGRGCQNGETRIAVLGSFGQGRDSAIQVDDARREAPEQPESLESMPYVEGFTPRFTRHFDFRYATPMPFAGTDQTSLRGYVRYREPEPQIREAQLLGLIDAWPPTTLPMLKTPVPASSLSWTVEFVQPMPSLKADEFCQYQADIIHASAGYGHTRAKIWNMQGELLAISQQTVTQFG